MSKRNSRVIRIDDDGLERVDAMEDFPVVVLPEDLKNAVRLDPNNCIFACAGKRTVGAQEGEATFNRTNVYLVHPGPDGVRRRYRYRAPRDVQELISAFDRDDRDEVMARLGRRFVLRAPSYSQSLDAKREQSRVQREKKRASIRGTISGDGPKFKKSKPRKVDLGLRNGTGCVHARNLSNA